MENGSRAMESIFNPGSVAVIGASDNPGKLGSHVMRSLVEGRYPGKIYPVNPGKDGPDQGDVVKFIKYLDGSTAL
jgi:acyl-CoA synthetase (NDP forming)